jgi:hypothetical protein
MDVDNLFNSLSFLLHIRAMDDASERLSIVVYPRTMVGYRVMGGYRDGWLLWWVAIVIGGWCDQVAGVIRWRRLACCIGRPAAVSATIRTIVDCFFWLLVQSVAMTDGLLHWSACGWVGHCPNDCWLLFPVACVINGVDQWPAALVGLRLSRSLSERLLIVVSGRLCDRWRWSMACCIGRPAAESVTIRTIVDCCFRSLVWSVALTDGLLHRSACG